MEEVEEEVEWNDYIILTNIILIDIALIKISYWDVINRSRSLSKNSENITSSWRMQSECESNKLRSANGLNKDSWIHEEEPKWKDSNIGN